MHLNAVQTKEIVFKIVNRIGVLADVAKILADKGIDLVGINASVSGELGILRLVTDDNLRAVEALRASGYDPKEESAIMATLPHKPGTLHRLSEILAEVMIDTHHVYATAAGDGGDCRVVLHTANDDRALVVLNEAVIGAPAG